MTRLHPASTYAFRVTASNGVGASTPSEASEAFTSSAGAPGVPGAPKAVEVTHDSVCLEWAPSDPQGAPVAGYVVHLADATRPAQPPPYPFVWVNGVLNGYSSTRVSLLGFAHVRASRYGIR